MLFRSLQVLALIATFLIAAPIHYKLERSAWSVILNYPRLLGGWIAVAGLLRSSRSERLSDSSLRAEFAAPSGAQALEVLNSAPMLMNLGTGRRPRRSGHDPKPSVDLPSSGR